PADFLYTHIAAITPVVPATFISVPPDAGIRVTPVGNDCSTCAIIKPLPYCPDAANLPRNLPRPDLGVFIAREPRIEFKNLAGSPLAAAAPGTNITGTLGLPIILFEPSIAVSQ